MIDGEDLPFEEQDIVQKLLIRAAIRRKIGRTVDGKEDRIALTCEEAAHEIIFLRLQITNFKTRLENMGILY